MQSGDRGGLIGVLERRYGARAPRLTAFYENERKAIYRVDRDGDAPWVVRHYPAERPMERLLGQVAIMRHLERQGVAMERVVLTSDGGEVTELGGRGVLVTTLLEGAVPRRTPEALRRLGESIGQLHALPTGAADEPLLARWARAMPREDLAGGRAWLEEIKGKVPDRYRAQYERLVAALDGTRDCEGLPPGAYGLLHNDCHMANAIELADGSVAWFDWDGVGRGPRIAMLGLLLYSCAVRYPDERGQDGKVGDQSEIARRVEAVLSGYVRHHRPSDAELEYLPDAVRFRPVVVAARELAAAIERDAAPDETGWWGRYADADEVAACARRVMGWRGANKD